MSLLGKWEGNAFSREELFVRFNLKKSITPLSNGIQEKDRVEMEFKHYHLLTGSLKKFYKFSLSQIPYS